MPAASTSISGRNIVSQVRDENSAHVLRQLEIAGDHRPRVVIATQQEARTTQPPHLLGEEQAGRKVLPVAVIEVAGNHDEGHVLVPRQIDHGGSARAGAVRRITPPADRRARTRPGKRAVQMDVGAAWRNAYARTLAGFARSAKPAAAGMCRPDDSRCSILATVWKDAWSPGTALTLQPEPRMQAQVIVTSRSDSRPPR